MKSSPKIPSPKSLWPETKAGVIAIAELWMDPSRVSINHEAIARTELPRIEEGADPGMSIGKEHLPLLGNVELALALNSINYQFWEMREGEFYRYEFEGTVGAMGMRKAFERNWADPESPLNQARNGKMMTTDDVLQMFGDIPEPESRAQILNEMLGGPLREVSAQVVAALESGRVDTLQANLVATNFPISYSDDVLKKAQLAISEAWVNARAQGRQVECDLTAFADYQIPNILRAMGVLEYSPELAAKIEAYELIPEGSADELAIRGASVLAVEEMAVKAGVPVAAVDHYLWMRRKEATTPFHLTVTTAY